MGKRIIDNFDKYHSMINSGNEDFIKFALQDLFEQFGKGYVLIGSSYRKLSDDLSMLLSKTHTARIRKWVYHCACYCPEPKVIKKCFQKLFSETKKDNILWCLSALSTIYTDEKLKSKLPRQKIEEFKETISPNIFDIASNLFSNFKLPNLSQDKVESIIQHGQPIDKIFVTTVFGYTEIAIRRKVSDIVTEKVIESLTNDDDPSVREYAYWALYLGNGSHKKRLRGDHCESNDIKKWIYANDITVLNTQKKFDLIEEMLHYASVQEFPIKVGILRGLESVDYHREYVNILISWLNHERDPYIRTKILERFIKYCITNAIDENEKKGSYITVLEDEINNGSNLSNTASLVNSIEKKSDIYLKKTNHYWEIDSTMLNKKGEDKKMKIFLGSSTKAIGEMEEVGLLLEELKCEVLPWNVPGKGIFPANENTIDGLIDITKRVDAAVFIFNADDEIWHHKYFKECKKVRDNVLFEYGLFVGKLGKKRVCFVCNGNPELATDLLGVIYISGSEDRITKKYRLRDWIEAM